RFSDTLLLPLWAVAVYGLIKARLPHEIFTIFFAAPDLRGLGIDPAAVGPATLGPVVAVFLLHWVAAVLLWFWNRHAHPLRVLGAGVVAFAVGLGIFHGAALFQLLDFDAYFATGPAYAWLCVLGGAMLLAWDAVEYKGDTPWTKRDVAMLQSPLSGAALHVEEKLGEETLVTATGERFAIRNGIARFTPVVTGFNKKYHRLYQAIGGLYDDVQRVFFALSGIDRRKYFARGLDLLEIKPGDRVLETSVGTGLNFFYLPRGCQYFGLDLSGDMLAAAQRFLARMRVPATLIEGNAEALPFADGSMDVVFHCGGINSFSDKARAIAEMIRVAKPGSRILIADETETLVQNVYEKVPLSGLFFKHRSAPVTPPTDLIPPEMEEVKVQFFRQDEFYAITFRKPALG
ncbi:MAG: methyltransferase domain-containing protein, partial [Rhizomicrobium sp.]